MSGADADAGAGNGAAHEGIPGTPAATALPGLPRTVAEGLEDFTGREWVLERVDAWLGGTAPRLLVTGPPGAGKSLVAARVLQVAAGHAPAGGLVHLGAQRPTHALFCEANSPWTQNPLTFVESLSARLAGLHGGFRSALLRSGRREISISGQATAGSVAAGATVAGVNVAVHVHGLAAVAAFDEAVRKPLAALGEHGPGRPVLVVVDALDEALRFGRGNLVELLSRILHPAAGPPASLRFLLTARSNDARVLDALGPTDLDLVQDAPPDADDVARYAHKRLDWLGEPARSTLAARVAGRRRGNFLYAFHVLADLRAHPERADDPDALRLPGDLQGVYHEFLTRELAPTRLDDDWRLRHRPVLALLAAAKGDGLDSGTVAQAAGRLVGRRMPRSHAADALAACAPFLSGPLGDGPVRIYHESFREFLLDDPDVRPMARGEADLALAELFCDEWADDWPRCDDDYALRYTTAHLVAALRANRGRAERAELRGRVIALLTDVGFLQAKLARLGPRTLIEDYDEAAAAVGDGDDAGALRLLQDAVQLSASALGRDPEQLVGHLIGRLSGHRGTPAVAALLEGAGRPRGRPWLCPLTPSLVSAGGPVRRILHHDSPAAVAITPDGRRAVSGALGGTVKIWDLDEQGPPVTLAHADAAAAAQPDATAAVTAVAITPDGRRVLSGSLDGVVRLWDVEQRRSMRTLQAGPTLRELAVASEGSSAATVCDGQGEWFPYWFATVGVWDVETGAELRLLRFAEQVFLRVALAADGRRVVFAARARSGATSLQVAGLDEGPETVAEDQDGRRRHLVDAVPRILAEGHAVRALAVTPDGRRAVAWTDDPASGQDATGLGVWDLDGVPPRRVRRATPGWQGAEAAAAGSPPASTLAVAADGRSALTGHSDGTLRAWDLEASGSSRQPTLRHGAPVVAVALTRDGRRAISAGVDGTLKVWGLAGADGPDTHVGEPGGAPARGERGVPAAGVLPGLADVAVTPDGRRAVTAYAGRVSAWELADPDHLATVPAGGTVVAVAITPDGRRAVWASMEGAVRAWAIDDEAEATTLADWGRITWSAAISSDACRAVLSRTAAPSPGASSGPHGPGHGAAGLPSWQTIVWSGEETPSSRTLAGAAGDRVLAVTPDGRHALSVPAGGRDDGTLHVWDLDRDDAPVVVRHDHPVQKVALTRAGRAVSLSAHRPSREADRCTVQAWDLAGDGEPRVLARGEGILALGVSADGRWMVLGSADGTVALWDLEAVRPVASFLTDSPAVACAAATVPEGALVVCGDTEGGVHLLELRD